MNKVIKQSAEAAAETVIAKLKEQGYLEKNKNASGKSAFQKTEILLYNYYNFKAAIKDKQMQIDFIKKNGILPVSKSVTFAQSTPVTNSDTVLAAERIDALEKSISMTKYYIQLLENSLDAIKDDMYFDIIRLKYFENLSIEDIAERLFVDKSTICRNRKRLIDMLKIRLFSDEVIIEMQ